MDSIFNDQVEVIDIKRPTKNPWKWSRQTYESYNSAYPGRYTIVGEKTLKVSPIEVNQLVKKSVVIKGEALKPVKRKAKYKP